MKSIVVRPVTQDDFPELKKLMMEYIVDFYEFEPPSDEQLVTLMKLLLEQREGMQFVAESDGRLIGFATLYFTYSTLRAAKVIVMNDLYVQEAYRGTGAASKLFTACKEYTANNGFANMSWVTAEDNYRAQRFYDKIGGERGSWLSYSIKPTIKAGD